MAKKKSKQTQQPLPRRISNRNAKRSKASHIKPIQEDQHPSKSQNSHAQIHSDEQKAHVRQDNMHDEAQNLDIDIYFAPCITSSKQSLEEEKKVQDFMSKPQKQNKHLNYSGEIHSEVLKQEYMQEQRSQNIYLKKILQSEQCQKMNFEHDSPLFGGKQMKRLMTPPNKLEDYKVYENDQVVKRDLMDQLDEGSKLSSQSFYKPYQRLFQKENNAKMSEKKKNRRRKHPSSRKQTQNSQKQSYDDRITFSFRRPPSIPSASHQKIKRLTECLSLATLNKTIQSYEKSYRILAMIANAVKGLVNYHSLRELSPQVLGFRKNVERCLNEEIERMSECLLSKINICKETIEERIKKSHAESDLVSGRRNSFNKALKYE